MSKLIAVGQVVRHDTGDGSVYVDTIRREVDAAGDEFYRLVEYHADNVKDIDDFKQKCLNEGADRLYYEQGRWR